MICGGCTIPITVTVSCHLFLAREQDLVTEADAAAVEAAVVAMNPMAKRLPCSKSRVPLDEILNIGAFQFERLEAVSAAIRSAVAVPPTAVDHAVGSTACASCGSDDHSTDAHLHDVSIHSVCCTVDAPLVLDKVWRVVMWCRVVSHCHCECIVTRP